MGTFGHKLFDDDFALDVRDSFIEALRDGLTPEQATDLLRDQFAASLNEEEEAAVFWLALAETQWKLGRLIDGVRVKALEAVDSGVNPSEWGELAGKRRSELERIRKRLLSEQSDPKRLPKGVPKLRSGDVFRFTHIFDNPEGKFRVHFYGRVIVGYDAAFYNNNNLHYIRINKVRDALSRGEKTLGASNLPFELEDVLLLDVAFIGSCYAGFAEGKYRVIGNVPLEAKFTRPILFYRRPVGSDICFVYDIWDSKVPHEEREVHITELDPRIEQWSATHHRTVLGRLGLPYGK